MECTTSLEKKNGCLLKLGRDYLNIKDENKCLKYIQKANELLYIPPNLPHKVVNTQNSLCITGNFWTKSWRKVMKWNNLSLTLKVRLISNFFQEIITTAFLPFMALYLSDMTSTKFAGIFLTLLVLLNFPISFFAGYLIEFFPKKNLYYFINF